MKFICHGLGIGVLVLVKLHGVPAVLAPPLPVLDYYAGFVILLLQTSGVLQQFGLAVITLAAVDVAESPVGHIGNPACQIAVGTDYLIGRS